MAHFNPAHPDVPSYDNHGALEHPAAPLIEKLARAGYVAKGVVYALVGVLAASMALGNRGDAPGSRGALAELMDQPFGQILVGVIALGLIGYAIWQFVRAIRDPDRVGSDAKGIAKRLSYFFTGLVHSALVIAAIRMIVQGARGGDDDQHARGWTATAMSYPAGRWLIAIIGVALAIYGLRQLYRAYAVKLDKQLNLAEMSASARRWAIAISRFGIAARGVVFGLIGWFLITAAWQHDPNEARGIGGALESLAQAGYGPWLLGIVALGLIGYGIYELIRAKYRRFDLHGA